MQEKVKKVILVNEQKEVADTEPQDWINKEYIKMQQPN